MEPIKINVNIEVGLKQTTLEALAVIFNPWKGCTCTCADTFPQPEPQSEPQPEPRSEPQPETHPEPEAQAPVEDDDDLPPGDAPDPVKKTPTESDARNAVAAAKKRGVPAAKIKEYMKDTFDIDSSVMCPPDRRQDLIDGLNKLAA